MEMCSREHHVGELPDREILDMLILESVRMKMVREHVRMLLSGMHVWMLLTRRDVGTALTRGHWGSWLVSGGIMRTLRAVSECVVFSGQLREREIRVALRSALVRKVGSVQDVLQLVRIVQERWQRPTIGSVMISLCGSSCVLCPGYPGRTRRKLYLRRRWSGLRPLRAGPPFVWAWTPSPVRTSRPSTE